MEKWLDARKSDLGTAVKERQVTADFAAALITKES